ncbi:uncharacterized protein LOC118749568 [Rhagoletis pomonella]|uniref:uncharacterized protein LOC118749568 n=1 Tax=Rhagoletis pomonella TaxID=28610 RepID=UPI0017875514|nr:uncharacterized protein LOC118749568 [Rhagoletis pomonella]
MPTLLSYPKSWLYNKDYYHQQQPKSTPVIYFEDGIRRGVDESGEISRLSPPSTESISSSAVPNWHSSEPVTNSHESTSASDPKTFGLRFPAVSPASTSMQPDSDDTSTTVLIPYIGGHYHHQPHSPEKSSSTGYLRISLTLYPEHPKGEVTCSTLKARQQQNINRNISVPKDLMNHKRFTLNERKLKSTIGGLTPLPETYPTTKPRTYQQLYTPSPSSLILSRNNSPKRIFRSIHFTYASQLIHFTTLFHRLTKMFRNSSRVSPLLFFQGSRVRPPENQTYPLYDVAPLHLAVDDHRSPAELSKKPAKQTQGGRNLAHRCIRELLSRAVMTLEKLQELLHLAPVQAGRHVEDMGNLIDFDD